jgi:2-oxoisovalerate ferredoxin oxidoreductase beta subunit
MTGGQLAPTSLVGQNTATSPGGRNPAFEGYPLHICETLNQLKAPVYIERCSVADSKRIMQTRRAIRKAIEIQRDYKGYAFIEILSPCPTNLRANAVEAARFVTEQMELEFPLGCFRDNTADAAPRVLRSATTNLHDLYATNAITAPPPPATKFVEKRMKFSGWGGQGILSLGIAMAEAGRFAGLHSSWFPSYGPEQRGGSASCTVVVSDKPIGSPDTTEPDVLVCMNRPAFERFASTVRPGGHLVCDALIGDTTDNAPAGIRMTIVPATKLAADFGVPQAANTVMLAVLNHLKASGIPKEQMLAALDASFAKKPKLIPINRRIFDQATTWCEENLPK